MAIDWDAQLYSTVHAEFGVTCVFTTMDAEVITLTALDKSAGIAVAHAGDISIQSLTPACVVRVAALTDAGIEASDLEDANLLMSGSYWTVKAIQPRPSPRGESSGEIYLFLEAGSAPVVSG